MIHLNVSANFTLKSRNINLCTYVHRSTEDHFLLIYKVLPYFSLMNLVFTYVWPCSFYILLFNIVRKLSLGKLPSHYLNSYYLFSFRPCIFALCFVKGEVECIGFFPFGVPPKAKGKNSLSKYFM